MFSLEHENINKGEVNRVLKIWKELSGLLRASRFLGNMEMLYLRNRPVEVFHDDGC